MSSQTSKSQVTQHLLILHPTFLPKTTPIILDQNMTLSTPFVHLFPALAISLVALFTTIHAQISSSPCSASMLTSFAPCMNFVTNNTVAGTSPSSTCCNSLKSITSNGTDCMCLIVTGSPFPVAINRTMAISLPSACNMSSVPLQCKASASPLPAPGPIALSPELAPASPTPPQVSTVPESTSPALAPADDTTPNLTPPSTSVSSQAPTANSGSRPVVNSSTAVPSASFSPSLFLTLLGAVVLKYYY